MPLLPTISLLLATLFAGNVAAEERMRLLVQSSPLAGAQYYAVAEVWPEMRIGDTLQLIREADNRHDRHAIRVEWRGHKLGYIPRAENRGVATAMDAGQGVAARVARLTDSADPWRRVEIEIFLFL